MGPRVSIVVPAYNAERFIHRALTSALSQTYQDIEVIVVDDGSTDSTGEMVQSVADPRIMYVRQRNSGQGGARNEGIRRSTGRYVTFLDADDYYLPEKVQKQVRFLQAHPNFTVTYCNALHFFSRWPEVFFKARTRSRHGNVLPELLHTSFINPNTVMMAREVLDRVGLFNETRYFPEEWEMWLRVALAGYEFGYLNEDLVVVEWRSDSNTTMEIQPVLKQNAIDMIQRIVPASVEVDGKVYAAEKTIRTLKLKKAVACLMVGQRSEFLDIVYTLFGRTALVRIAAACLLVLPSAFVKLVWRLNQIRNSVIVRNRTLAAGERRVGPAA